MVVFEDGAPRKAHYRRFRIAASTATGDDFAALARGARARRFALAGMPPSAAGRSASGSLVLDLPDLVLVDGGKGQLAEAANGACRSSV